jgi:hypothetical protein
MNVSPQIYRDGDVVEIDPSGVAGEAANLVTLVQAQLNTAAKAEPSGYLISNTSGGAAYVRTDTIGLAAANTGKGVKIADGESLWIPGIGNALQARSWGIEATGAVAVAVYYK